MDELSLRNHRLGLYLVCRAWHECLDCVVLESRDLLRFIGHSRRLQSKALERLRRDLRTMFPEQKLMMWRDDIDLALSRVEFPESVKYGPSHAWQLREAGLRADVVRIPFDSELIDLPMKLLLHGESEIFKSGCTPCVG